MSEVEVALRREAARRRLAGESPETIAADLGRTRQWVAKWAARYDPHDASWADGRSRAPKRVANRTSEDVEARVLAVRARLAENPWAQVGAEAIAWELEKLGGPVPPVRTIEEILARAGVTRSGRAEPQTDLQGAALPGAGGQASGGRGPGRPRRSAPSGRRGAFPRAHPDRRGLPSRRGRDRHRPRRPARARGALRAVGAPRAAAASAAGQRWPVRLADRPGGGCQGLPAPARHTRVHPATGTLAQRHDRALQQHLPAALLPPRALRRPAPPRRAHTGVRALPQQPAPLQGQRRTHPRPEHRSPRRACPYRPARSPPAGPSTAGSSSSASSAPTSACGSSAARSRCPTAAPTSTSPPRSTSHPPTARTCTSATPAGSCSPPPGWPPHATAGEDPSHDKAPGASHSAPSYGLRSVRGPSTTPSPSKRCACGDPSP